MPSVEFVYLLPKDVKEELINRIVGSGFGDYIPISDWLKSLGYDVGKSAIHRFGQKLKFKAKDAIPESDYPMIDFRLRCIEAAVPDAKEGKVLDIAQSYFDWIIQNK